MNDAPKKLESKTKEDLFFCLLASHQNDIASYIAILVPRDSDADDIYQEVCAVLWRKFDEFELNSSFISWGRKIAYYQILQYRRKKKIDQGMTYSTDTIKLLSDSYCEFRKNNDCRIKILPECVKKLSHKEQLLLQLRYYKSLPIKVIAEQLNLSTSMIFKQLARVHYFLRECILLGISKEEVE